jgi:catechol 2,3-dioxygenase-like lactoylglutathione lyase family enzyme
MSTDTGDQTPDREVSVDMASCVVRVSDLDRSLKFYCDVLSCRLAIREADVALVLTPKGFQIYPHQRDQFRRRGAGVRGVDYLMWATDSQSDLRRMAGRLRAYDCAVFSHEADGMTILEGTDPDGFRVIVAYPSPSQLPRTVIANRLRG